MKDTPTQLSIQTFLFLGLLAVLADGKRGSSIRRASITALDRRGTLSGSPAGADDGAQNGTGSGNGTNIFSELMWDLRICNAFGFKSGLDVFHRSLPLVSAARPLPEPLKLTHELLPYKRCVDIHDIGHLGPGSMLIFKVGGGEVIGNFRITALPPEGSSLLQLVVHRMDRETTAATFSSHVFGGTGDPEIALVDAYQGKSESGIAVRSWNGRWKAVRFGTVIQLRPGWYTWTLTGDHKKTFDCDKTVGFYLDANRKYTAMRIGMENSKGPDYAEELVLFPTSWVTTYGAATRSSGTCLAGFLFGAWSLLRLGV